MPKRYLYKYLTSAEHAHAMMRGRYCFDLSAIFKDTRLTQHVETREKVVLP